MSILIYITAAFGVAYVFGFSAVSLPVRRVLAEFKWTKWLALMVECPACLGWWTGFLIGLCPRLTWLFELGASSRWERALILAFFTAGSNFVLGTWAKLFAVETR